ncbi:hypothetical protein [Rhizobium sp. PP-CC-3G-465]|uniref:hypothetical protein n=1 Tax=Rhizobium sp. PP-CC-3G-465 TaxID=2135648 RepID=UPI0010443837
MPGSDAGECREKRHEPAKAIPGGVVERIGEGVGLPFAVRAGVVTACQGEDQKLVAHGALLLKVQDREIAVCRARS